MNTTYCSKYHPILQIIDETFFFYSTCPAPSMQRNGKTCRTSLKLNEKANRSLLYFLV